MIGKKVTGEYTVVVNGEKLSDKGAIIDGRANVPVRALSESLGVDIKVDGKTIMVTSEETPINNQVVQLDGKY
ncbi:stalk domain-containing protein, partial [Mycobacterium kansasii]